MIAIRSMESLMRSALLMLVSLIVVSCGTDYNAKSYDMKVSEESPYVFHLNDSTTQIATYIQPIDSNVSFRLMYLNMSMKSLCFFNFSDFEETDVIKIASQGPDAVDLANSGGVYYHSDDSIYIYNYWNKNFTIIDHNGSIVGGIPLTDLTISNGILPQLRATSISPLAMLDGKILMSGHPSYAASDTEDPARVQTMALMDTTEKTIRTFAEYPSDYKTIDSNRWNPFLYLVPDYCVGDRNTIVVSFPASDSIRVYDLNTLTYQSYFAGTDRDIDISAADNPYDESHLYGSYAYKGIKYDRWNDVYYRVLIRPVRQGVNINDFQGVNVPRPITVIVLDHDFNKIAETDFDDYHGSFIHMFVSPRGLSIHSYSDDDDYLMFRTFKPVSI